MLKIHDHNNIREVTINRPPVNALNLELLQALDRVLEKAQREADAVILSGREGLFSAGLDVPELLTYDRQKMADLWGSLVAAMHRIASLEIPIVAAITGHSPAGGAVLTLFCDYRIMAGGDYRIGLNEVQVGLNLPPIIYHALTLLVGSRRATQLGMRGLMLTSLEAVEATLVDQVVPGDEVISAAVEHSQGLLDLPRGAMLATRKLARTPLHQLFSNPHLVAIEPFVDNWFSDETQAVLEAMVKKLGR